MTEYDMASGIYYASACYGESNVPSTYSASPAANVSGAPPAANVSTGSPATVSFAGSPAFYTSDTFDGSLATSAIPVKYITSGKSRASANSRILLLDTNIFVDHFRGRPEACNIFKNICNTDIRENITLSYSVITRIELLCGARGGEEKAIEKLLNNMSEIDMTIPVADIAGRYMQRYYKSHSLSFGYAIVAASAKFLGALLYTLDTRHFPMDDIKVVRPY
ncbi:MAG: type II toxin-antitoxin system VapC family toxin [Clostridiales bacterium]|nr:type II toxin-antitoxin system VapC family toxin [Clostridiales bacterium]